MSRRLTGLGLAGWLLATGAAVADGPLAKSGAALYFEHCAACHGAHLEGEPDWETVGPDHRLRAPPHDQTGHTWMHSEAELFRLVKAGPPESAPDVIDPMPAFGDRLNDDQIRSVLAYIRSQWPPGYQAYQLLLDPDLDPARLPPGDWRLPANCAPPPLAAVAN